MHKIEALYKLIQARAFVHACVRACVCPKKSWNVYKKNGIRHMVHVFSVRDVRVHNHQSKPVHQTIFFFIVQLKWQYSIFFSTLALRRNI